MIKSKFAISLHILTLLANHADELVSSAYIAGSLNVNPVLVRNELSLLKKNNLIESKEGKNGGVRLLKDPKSIRLSDIFLIAKGDSNVFSFSKNTPEPKCPIGSQINDKLQDLFISIDWAIENELFKTSLEEFKNQF